MNLLASFSGWIVVQLLLVQSSYYNSCNISNLMEFSNTLDFKEKIIDFLIEKYSEFKNASISLNIIGSETPTSFLIDIEVKSNSTADSFETNLNHAIILYECSFNNDINFQTSSHLTFIIDFQTSSYLSINGILNSDEKIYYASLSSNKQFLGLCVEKQELENVVYICFIINLSSFSSNCDCTRLHITNSSIKPCKFQFIKMPINTNSNKMQRLTKTHLFTKIQITHILFSIDNQLIKYQKLSISPISIFCQKENILCSKLCWFEWKLDNERLYLIEYLNNSSLILKAFQLIWPIQEIKNTQDCEFQLLFSYTFCSQVSTNESYLLSKNKLFSENPRILEHSNGSICFCYEKFEKQYGYSYFIHLIHSEKIIECCMPVSKSELNQKILFTLYKNYLVIFTKYFVHLIDINYQSKNISSFIWPPCFDENTLESLSVLNTTKLSKIYLLKNSNKILSLNISLITLTNMIQENYSLTEKLGALNFIVYNSTRKEKDKIFQLMVNFIVDIKNSFFSSRLFEEFIVSSLNRNLRLKITDENIMRYIDSTTLPSQFSRRFQSINKNDEILCDEDVIKVRLTATKQEALVLFVKEKLLNPQIKRFFDFVSESKSKELSEYFKQSLSSNPKTNEVFTESKTFNNKDIPKYLSQIFLNDEQFDEFYHLLLCKMGLHNEMNSVYLHDFIDKIIHCLIEIWKQLLYFIHNSTFSDDGNLWNDVCHLKKSSNKRLLNFHNALGAFKYSLYSQKWPIPLPVNDLYLLTSYNVLSENRFLSYLKFSNFLFSSNNSIEFFIEFYKFYKLLMNKSGILERTKNMFLSKMSLSNKMKILYILNYDDQNDVIKEYGDHVNKQTGVFDQQYQEIVQKIYPTCDTPRNALCEFYKNSINQL